MSNILLMTSGQSSGVTTGSMFSPRIQTGPVPWLPWDHVNPIATHADEHAFVARLAVLCQGNPLRHARSDVTAVLNALRGGITVDSLLRSCPGLRPGRLYSAHLTLDAVREESVAAWSAIVEDPTVSTLGQHGEVAARLVPVLVHRLYETAAIDPRNLPRVAAHLAESVESLRTLVRNAEMQLDQGADTATATAISRTLYDPTSDAIFARPEHLPERVGSLVPTCVAALLCERDAAVPMRSAS